MGLKELKEEEDVGVMCVLNERVLQRQEKEALDQGSWSTLNIRLMATLLLMRPAHCFPDSDTPISHQPPLEMSVQAGL